MSMLLGASLTTDANELFSKPRLFGGASYTINGSTDVLVISFIDVISSTDCIDWITRLQTIKTAYDSSNVEIICVLYRNGSTPTSLQLAPIVAAFNSSQPTFPLLNNGAWSGSPAKTYYDELTGTPSDPYTYLVAPGYLITDKFHSGSPNNGHGSRTGGLVDNDFLNLDWAAATPTFAELEEFITRRVQDLLDNSPAFTISPNPAAPVYNSLPSIAVTFNRKAWHAHASGSYSLSGGVSINNVSPAGQINWSTYKTSGEVRTLTLNAITSEVNTSLGIAASCTDTKNTAFTAPADVSYHVDPVPPTVTSITGPSSPTSTEPIPITVTFSETIKSDGSSGEFTQGDVALSSGWSVTSGSFNSTANPVYTFQVEPANAAVASSVTVTVNNGVCQDIAGNLNTGGPDSISINYDPVPGLTPLIAVAAGTNDPTNVSPIPLTIDFQEAINPSSFSSTDLNDSGAGGSFSTPATADNRHWTVNYTPSSDGLKTLGITANSVQDPIGSLNDAASCTITYDGTNPTITDIDGPASTTSTTPMLITVTFSEEIKSDGTSAEFTQDDITLSSGWSFVTPSTFNAGGNPVYTVQVKPDDVNSAGTLTVTVNDGVCQDLAGNPNNGGPATFSVDYDPVPGLSPIISTTSGSPTNDNPIPVTINFQEVINPATFSASDLSDGFAGGSFSTPASTDNITWTSNYTPSSDGLKTISIGNASVQDPLGNTNSPASFSITYDGTRPFPNITSTTSSPTHSTVIPVSISFVSGSGSSAPDEIMDTEFTESDITLSTGWSVQTGSFDDTANPVFTFNAIPDNPASSSTLSVSVAANRCRDLAENQNEASTSASEVSIVYEPEPATDVKDIMLCVDFSYSMNDPITIDGVPGTKSSFVKEAIETLGSIWSSYSETTNYGLVVYRTHAEDLGGGLKPFDAATLDGEISGQLPGGSTALGAGLAISLNNLDYSNASYAHERAIILFADGQNNVNPYVSTVSTISYSIPAITGTGFPSSMSAVNVNSSDPAKTPVYTVGIGTNGGWLNLLSQINQISGAAFENATEVNQIWPNVENGLTDILDEILVNSSPQKIYSNHDTIPASYSEKEESFVLNKDTKRAIICVSWPGSSPVDLEIRKGSTKISQFTNIIHKNKHSVYVIDFPHHQLIKAIKPFDSDIFSYIDESFHSALSITRKDKLKTLKTIGKKPIRPDLITSLATEEILPEGNWNVIVKHREPGQTSPYNIIVIADEKNLKFHLKMPRDRIMTGEPFLLDLYSHSNNTPIHSLFRAVVKISAPSTCYGNVVDLFKDEIKIPEYLDFDHKLQYLDNALRSNKTAKAMLEKRELSTKVLSEVHLPKTAKNKKTGKTASKLDLGHYQTVIPKQKIPGIYKIDITIAGTTKKYGPFQRKFTRNVMVDFNFCKEKSEYIRNYDPIKRTTTIKMLPRDIYGNILGPGYSDYFIDNLDDLYKKRIKVTDHLNGRYTIVLGGFTLSKKENKIPKDYILRMDKNIIFKTDMKSILGKEGD